MHSKVRAESVSEKEEASANNVIAFLEYLLRVPNWHSIDHPGIMTRCIFNFLGSTFVKMAPIPSDLPSTIFYTTVISFLFHQILRHFLTDIINSICLFSQSLWNFCSTTLLKFFVRNKSNVVDSVAWLAERYYYFGWSVYTKIKLVLYAVRRFLQNMYVACRTSH